MKNKKVKQMIESTLDEMLNKSIDNDSLHRIYFNRTMSFFRPDFGELCEVVSLTADQHKAIK